MIEQRMVTNVRRPVCLDNRAYVHKIDSIREWDLARANAGALESQSQIVFTVVVKR